MKIKGEKAAELLFMIASSILGEEEYLKVLTSLDDVTIEEDNKNKKECETELRTLLFEIASFPDTWVFWSNWDIQSDAFGTSIPNEMGHSVRSNWNSSCWDEYYQYCSD